MATTEPLTGTTLPQNTDQALGGEQIARAVNQLAPLLNAHFATTSDRDTRWASWQANNSGTPIPDGASCWCDNPGNYFDRIGGAWVPRPFALADTAATGDSIAQRDSSGRLAVADPVLAGQAATKAYVDSTIWQAGTNYTNADAWTARPGWTISGGAVQQMGPGFAYALVAVTRNTTALPVQANGDIANTDVATIRGGFAPYQHLVPAHNAAVGRTATGYLSPGTGIMTLSSVTPDGGDIANGETIELAVALYRIAA